MKTYCFTLFIALGLFTSQSVVAQQLGVAYRYQQVRDAKIFYREAGDTARPVIVLLHGFPSSSHTYRNLIPLLAGKYHVIAPDNLGSGYSTHLSPDSVKYTFDMLADYTYELLEKLKVKKYILYMQDFGAPVGYRVMQRDPQRIQALIIQNANAYLDGLTPARQDFFRLAHTDTSRKEIDFLYGLTSRDNIINRQYLFDIDSAERFRQSPDAWTFDLFFFQSESDRKIQVQLFQDYYNNLLSYPAWQQMLRIVQPKTLIVWGAKDVKFTADGARAYLRDLPKAELHLLEAGHFAVEEKPAEIGVLILQFLKASKME